MSILNTLQQWATSKNVELENPYNFIPPNVIQHYIKLMKRKAPKMVVYKHRFMHFGYILINNNYYGATNESAKCCLVLSMQTGQYQLLLKTYLSTLHERHTIELNSIQ